MVTLVCVSVCPRPHAHTCTDDPDATRGRGRGCPLVVHYWADLQSVHGLRCYGNITRTRNVSEYVLVLALCLVVVYDNDDDENSNNEFTDNQPTRSLNKEQRTARKQRRRHGQRVQTTNSRLSMIAASVRTNEHAPCTRYIRRAHAHDLSLIHI